MRVRRVGSVAEVPVSMTADHLLTSGLEPDEFTVAWVGLDDSVAYGGSSRGRGLVDWLTVAGPGAAALLRYVLDELPCPPQGISVPRGTDLRGVRIADSEVWDQMVRGAGPLASVPGEERVIAVTPNPLGDEEISDLLALANPTYSVRPGDPGIQVWAVMRDAAGALLGCGAYSRRAGGDGWLGSIATRPSARGQGIGAAISAWLTRRSIAAGDRLCALHHWHPNESARRIYTGLGYTTTHRMISGTIEFQPHTADFEARPRPSSRSEGSSH